MLWAHDLLDAAPFSKKRIVRDDLAGAMKRIIDGIDRDFKTQSLRIGAETFFVTYGLPELLNFWQGENHPEWLKFIIVLRQN